MASRFGGRSGHLLVLLSLASPPAMARPTLARGAAALHPLSPRCGAARPLQVGAAFERGCPRRPQAAAVMAEGADDSPKQPKRPRRRWAEVTRKVLFLLLGATLAWAWTVFTASGPQRVEVPYSELVAQVRRGQVVQAIFAEEDRALWVTTLAGQAQRVAINPAVAAPLVALLSAKDVAIAVQSSGRGSLMRSALETGDWLLTALVLLGLLSLRFGNSAGGGGGGGSLGMLSQMRKSGSELQLVPETGVTFADVAGCDSSKQELSEVVEFLKTPGKFLKVGARAPRGVLLEGPPGTGKTLLARAVAGEAGVPFLLASGSEFVEMFVGVGASRIRDLFGRAKKSAPCIIFVDEIDAIGKARGGGAASGGGNDEREQTLNQILTEMDGFDKAAGVVVLAATNRPDVLDPALLRPGRFDRRVPVELPDREGRLAILKVHARDKPLGADVDLGAVAARTTGFSGAALANLLNEAAIVTARRDLAALGAAEIEHALDRLTVGLEQRTGMASDERKRLVAYHEAGHAIVAALTPSYDTVTKVTIVPRSGGAGGFTLFVPSDERQDSGLYSRSYLDAQLAVALGGRVAEELVYGPDEVTTGAASDLQRVADVARRMVTQWGFATESLGSTAWELPVGTGFGTPKMASEATQQRIDAAVETIVKKAHASARATLSRNKALLDRLAQELVEHETIDAPALMALVASLAVSPSGE